MKQILALVVLLLCPSFSIKHKNDCSKNMSWKLDVIIINQRYAKPITEITKDLGLGESRILRKSTLGTEIESENLCVGFYDGKTIVTQQGISMLFFDERPGVMEKAFYNLFPESEILVQGVHENVGIQGFSFIRNGQRVRTKLVGEEEGPILDYGSKLDEEGVSNFFDLCFDISKKMIGRSIIDKSVLKTGMYVLELKK